MFTIFDAWRIGMDMVFGTPKKEEPMPPPFKVQKADSTSNKPKVETPKQVETPKENESTTERAEERQGNCKACEMLAAGVKFRRAPVHTCKK